MKTHVHAFGDAEAITCGLDRVVSEVGEGIDPAVANASRRVLEASTWDCQSGTSESVDVNGP